MKNSQKGFVTQLLIVIAVLVIGGGVAYLMIHKNQNSANSGAESVPVATQVTTSNTAAEQRYNQLIAQRQAAELPNPPSGFLVPNSVPSGYSLESQMGTYFSSSSTAWKYQAQKTDSFGPRTEYLQFYEVINNTFDNYVKTETKSTVQTVRVVKNFTYNGNDGVVLGTFVNEKSYQISPTTSDIEYWLVYNDYGKLLTIHTTDPTDITPDILIGLLKNMIPKK